MRRKLLLSLMLLTLGTIAASAQTSSSRSSGGTTKAAGGETTRTALPRNRLADERGNASGAIGGEKLAPAATGPALRVAGPLKPVAVAKGEPSLGSITKGTGVLPNDGGQVWREYELTPYTS